MTKMNLWIELRNLDKMSVTLGRDPKRKQFVYHRREVMLDCVIKCVRGWLPNPLGVEYMGRLWE